MSDPADAPTEDRPAPGDSSTDGDGTREGDDAPGPAEDADPSEDSVEHAVTADATDTTDAPEDTADTPEGAPDEEGTAAEPDREEVAAEPDLEALRAEVEEKYDFDNFGPADMAEMTGAEWEAVFDPDTWITGRDLLDRVERDLRTRIAAREVFAVLERRHDPESVVAYSDEGYAIVYPDGSVEGEGTVLRDVKGTVALCSMDSYEVPDPPGEYGLPTPQEVESGTGEFGNRMLQAVAGAQILAGLGLAAAWLLSLLPGDPGVPFLPDLALTTAVAPVMAAFFLFVGVALFGVVANARLSDRFRAEEYRDRLRAAGITDGDAPEFASFEEVVDDALAAARDRDGGGDLPSPSGREGTPREPAETDG